MLVYISIPNTDCWGPNPRVSDSVGLECISISKYSDKSNDTDLGNHILQNHCPLYQVGLIIFENFGLWR